MNFCIVGYLRIKSSPNSAISAIKTNFHEAIKYFQLTIAEIVLFKIFTLVGFQNWKNATWMPKSSLYTCMTMCMYREGTYSPYYMTHQDKLRRLFSAFPG